MSAKLIMFSAEKLYIDRINETCNLKATTAIWSAQYLERETVEKQQKVRFFGKYVSQKKAKMDHI